ncbi:MAG: hypothetical protein WD449_00425 [Candidatus Babeliales bacterium]
MKYIFFVILTLITGCSSRNNSGSLDTPSSGNSLTRKKSSPIPSLAVPPAKKPMIKAPKKVSARNYALTIEGMTCPICEKSVFYYLRKLPGIENIAIQDHHEASQEHRLVMTWRNKENPPLGALVQAVEKEDFLLHQLSGKLRGTFMQKNGKKLFVVEGTGEPFCVTRAVGDARVMTNGMWEKIHIDQLLWVSVGIWRDSNDGVYKVALLNEPFRG